MFAQYYHTRCSAAESFFGQEGFGVRAASVPAEEIKSRQIHLLLADLALYELPLGARDEASSASGLAVGKAPIRLARIRTADGDLALVHSVYRADAGNRKMSYFSHVVLVPPQGPAVTASQCLALWGSEASWAATSGWVWREPPGNDPARSKVLPEWIPPAVDSGPIVSLESVCRFLRGKPARPPASCPALELSPRRLQGEEHFKLRRELIQAIIAAFLNRQRVFLIAETGLSALLIYALTRLLPGELVDSLTFSTYEPLGKIDTSPVDIVNTVADPHADLQDHILSGARGGLLINSHSFAESTAALLDPAASSYAAYAVDHLLKDSLGDLEAFWQLSRELLQGEQELDNTSFLRAWTMVDRLSTLESRPLSDSESEAYLIPTRSRQLMFERSPGRAQTVDFAVRGYADTPPWWPADSRDTASLDSFRPFLEDFRELVVSRIVSEFECVDNPNEHLDIANYCLGKLLPGITDHAYTPQQAFSDVVDRLEQGDDGRRLAKRLPGTTRNTILLMLAKQTSRVKTSASLTTDQLEKWLHAVSVEELQAICGKEIPEAWKAQAVSIWLLSHAECDLVIAQMLLAQQDLLSRCLRMASSESPDRAKRCSAIVVKIFNAFATAHERMVFCIALLKTQHVSHDENLRHLYEKFLCQLVDAKNTPWHLLFLDDSQLDTQLSETLGPHSPTLTHVWGACCRCLDISCLDANQEQHKMLLALLSKEKRNEIKWTTETAQSRQRLVHWRRVYSAHHSLPSDAEWHALRWSIKSLGVDDPGLLGHLIHQLFRPVHYDLLDLGEIVDCARVMLPRHCPVSVLAGKLMKATERLPEATRHAVQVALLADVCQGNVIIYEELLAGMKDTLPEKVADELEAKRDALLQKRFAVDCATTRKARRKDLFVSFGLPIGLTIVGIVVFVMHFISAPSGFSQPRGSVILGIFLVSSLAIAFFQSWHIYKRRTQYHDQSGQLGASSDCSSAVARRGSRGERRSRVARPGEK